MEAQRRKGAALLIPVREKRGKGGGAVRHGVRSSERRGRPTTHGDDGGGWRSGEQGRRAGGSSMVACGPHLESMGRPGEKRNGPRPRKQFRAAVVN
jgi:hypothetical protein